MSELLGGVFQCLANTVQVFQLLDRHIRLTLNFQIPFEQNVFQQTLCIGLHSGDLLIQFSPEERHVFVHVAFHQDNLIRQTVHHSHYFSKRLLVLFAYFDFIHEANLVQPPEGI